MSSVAYYIGSHGFGHAARQQPVIRNLVKRGVEVYVRTAAPSKFFNGTGIHYHSFHYDIGLIQQDALSVDVDATFNWYADFLNHQPALIESEAAFVRENNIQLIVTDMPPVACEIAETAGIPCVAVTHFTWDWVYEHYVGSRPHYRSIIQSIRQSYGKATLALEMPFAHPLDMFPVVEPVPLVVNPITRSPQEVRAELEIAPDARIALLSMGGMSWGNVDVTPLCKLTHWTFLVIPDIWEQVKHWPNFRLIPTDYDGYHNLINAADVLIGKAGWSTVAECIAHRTPMIYTIRDDYRENELLDAALCKFANSAFVKKHEFESLLWVEKLDWMVERVFNWPEIQTNGAKTVTERLMSYLKSP